jgi:hypothetical protein
MKKHRLGIVGLLVLGMVLVLCSCGGGGSSSSKRLNKEQFAAKANALCTEFSKQAGKAGSTQTAAQTIAFFNKMLPLNKKFFADFGKLKPPADEEAAVNQIVGLGKEQVARIKTMIALIKGKDRTQADKLTRKGAANLTARQILFTELGINVCAKT